MSSSLRTTSVLDTRLDVAGMSNNSQIALLQDPKFRELVKKRNGLAVTLSVLMLAIYSVFILLVAFDKPLLATKVAGTTSLGIVLGLVVIVTAFVLTAIYVVRANGRFDALTADLVREYGR